VVTTDTDQVPAPVGLRIRLRRKRAKLTQKQLAAALGIGERQVIRYEQDDSLPSEQIASKLAELLGGTPDDYQQPARPALLPRDRELERLRTTNQDLARRLDQLEELVGELLTHRTR
jgi:transcriptional regulator with XRE-family HTH domain